MKGGSGNFMTEGGVGMGRGTCGRRAGTARTTCGRRAGTARTTCGRRAGTARTTLGGFTLIEVMVALAVFALSTVVIGAAYVNVLSGYNAASKGFQRDEDLRFARSLLMAQADIKKVEEGGEFDTADQRRVRWSGTVEPTNTADLFTVTFTCEISSLGTVGNDRKVTEVFRLLRPTWSEDADRTTLREEARKRIEEFNQGKQR